MVEEGEERVLYSHLQVRPNRTCMFSRELQQNIAITFTF